MTATTRRIPPPTMRLSCHYLLLFLTLLTFTLTVDSVYTSTHTLLATDPQSLQYWSGSDPSSSRPDWSGSITFTTQQDLRGQDIQIVSLTPTPSFIPTASNSGGFSLYGQEVNYTAIGWPWSAPGPTRNVLIRLAPTVYFSTMYSMKPLRCYLTSVFTCDPALPALGLSDRVVGCTANATAVAAAAAAQAVLLGAAATSINDTTTTNSTGSTTNTTSPSSTLPPLYDFNLTYTTSAVITSDDLYPLTHTFTYTSSSPSITAIPDQLLQEAIFVLFHRMASDIVQIDTLSAISSANTTRRNKARVAVGFLWFFCACVMFFTVIMLATFQSWFYPLFPYPHAITIWIVLLCALTAGISAGTGIAGFLVLLLIYLALCCTIGLVYYIQRLRNRETPVSLNDDDGDTTGGVRAVHQHYERTSRKKKRALLKQRELQQQQQEQQLKQRNVGGAGAAGGGGGTILVGERGGSNAVGNSLGVPSSSPHRDDSSTPTTDGGNGGSGDIEDPAGLHPNNNARPSLLKSSLLDESSSYPFSARPLRFGYKQRRILGLSSMLFLTCFVLCVALFGVWRMDSYHVVDRSGSLPAQSNIIEYIPQTIAKSVASVYSFDNYATKLRMDSIFFSLGTEWCGTHYSAILNTDDEKYRAIQQNYIEKYQIDMSLFIPDSYLGYNSVNSWFIRNINTKFRPVDASWSVVKTVNETIVNKKGNYSLLSPADARVTVWSNNPDGLKFWIKGESFTLDDFLTPQIDSTLFQGGTFVLVRLAPQDYHQFHSVLDATLVKYYRVEGSLQSVNSDGMTSKNHAIYNQRTVMLFHSDLVGHFAYVAIGALCVGSVYLPSPAGGNNETAFGTEYKRGDKLGYFQFGSTIALVFQRGKIRFEDDLVQASQRRVETLVQVNSRLGVVVNQDLGINTHLMPTGGKEVPPPPVDPMR